jgi:DNA-binding NarL/FixJ family response regulator
MRPRVLVADDHELVRHGLRRLIEDDGRWDLVGEATDGQVAVELAARQRPDVAVLDYAMPRLNGLEATRRIRADLPNTEVLILTMHDSELLVREVLEAGARGFILKSDAGRLLVQAIETLLEHKPFFTPRVSELLLGGYLRSRDPSEPGDEAGGLTGREREVLQMLAEGRSTKEVADLLGLSVKTAETHRANLMRKLGARSLADLVRYAVRNKIIEP